MKKVYFTSDWHLYHTNIIKYSHRPFRDYKHMNKMLLQNYFDTVKTGDTVFFLGDFTFGRQSRYDEIVDIVKQITDGINFHVILGNHDHERIVSLFKKYATSVEKLKEIKIGDQSITMCHYPMVSYKRSHRNAWQLYGHHHRSTADIVQGKKWNVCVDTTHFKPLSFKELKKIMVNRNSNWDYIELGRDEHNQKSNQTIKSLEELEKSLKAIEIKFAHEFNAQTPTEIRMKYAAKRIKLIKEINQRKKNL